MIKNKDVYKRVVSVMIFYYISKFLSHIDFNDLVVSSQITKQIETRPHLPT